MPIPLTARDPVPFTPPALRRRIEAENAELLRDGKPEREMPAIIVRVPTMYERDAFSAMLVRGGVIHYSRKQIRELMLAGVAFLYDDADFERIRGDLEDLWDHGDAWAKAEMERSERLIELAERNVALPEGKRMTDEEMAAELDAIQPGMVLPEAQRVRVTAIQQDITSRYEPLQKAFADLAEQEVRRAWLCVEVYVVGWTGFEHAPAGNARGGITRAEAEYLRAKIEQEAFEQLGDFIFSMHSLDGDEEKNLASLIENASALTGSTAAESRGENEHGSSTAEPITPTPDDASATTTASSSSSTKPSARRTARSKSSRTGARS